MHPDFGVDPYMDRLVDWYQNEYCSESDDEADSDEADSDEADPDEADDQQDAEELDLKLSSEIFTYTFIV